MQYINVASESHSLDVGGNVVSGNIDIGMSQLSGDLNIATLPLHSGEIQLGNNESTGSVRICDINMKHLGVPFVGHIRGDGNNVAFTTALNNCHMYAWGPLIRFSIDIEYTNQNGATGSPVVWHDPNSEVIPTPDEHQNQFRHHATEATDWTVITPSKEPCAFIVNSEPGIRLCVNNSEVTVAQMKTTGRIRLSGMFTTDDR